MVELVALRQVARAERRSELTALQNSSNRPLDAGLFCRSATKPTYSFMKKLYDLVRDIKANSSRFISEKRWLPGRFSRQEGFGAFSYSRSQLGTVIRYIENQ